MPAPLSDTSRLCIHTITTRPWPLEIAIDRFAAHGVAGITVWRDALEGRDIKASGRRIRETGLEIVSLCRGGFFPAETATDRQKAIDDNRRAVEEAAELGAPLVVLVPGAVAGQSLELSRQQIQEGIEAVLPDAEAANVRLGVEPLHPMYADTRSAINTLAQANQICRSIDSAYVGVIYDVYHLWWDPDLRRETARCGQDKNLFAFHVCDWRVPTEDILLDRGVMGEGAIPVREIRSWVEESGFDGLIEVEIFSKRLWSGDQEEVLEQIVQAYLNHV